MSKTGKILVSLMLFPLIFVMFGRLKAEFCFPLTWFCAIALAKIIAVEKSITNDGLIQIAMLIGLGITAVDCCNTAVGLFLEGKFLVGSIFLFMATPFNLYVANLKVQVLKRNLRYWRTTEMIGDYS